MPDNSTQPSSDYAFFDDFLDKQFGEGDVDLDNFSSRDLKVTRRIRETMKRINRPRTGTEGQAQGSDPGSRGSDPMGKPSDPGGRPVGQTQGQTGGQTVGQTLGPLPSAESAHQESTDLTGYKINILPSEIDGLARTPFRRRLLAHLLKEGNQVTSYAQISAELEEKPKGIRKALDHFEVMEILSRETIRTASFQGMKITLLLSQLERESLLEKLRADLGADPGADGGSDHGGRPLGQTDRMNEEENSSIVKNRLARLAQDDLKLMFPALVDRGFTINHLRKALELMETGNHSLEVVSDSLRYAEWDAAHDKMVDTKGVRVKHVGAYVVQALAQNGYYRKPADYQDLQKKVIEAEKERQRALEKEEEDLFETWRKGLPEEFLAKFRKDLEARAGNSFIPFPLELKKYWRENILSQEEASPALS